MHVANNEEEAPNLFSDTNRAISETPMNTSSSRFKVFIKKWSLERLEATSFVGRSHIVDLAGRSGRTRLVLEDKFT